MDKPTWQIESIARVIHPIIFPVKLQSLHVQVQAHELCLKVAEAAVLEISRLAKSNTLRDIMLQWAGESNG